MPEVTTLSPDELIQAGQQLREVCMRLISASLERPVGLYEQHPGKSGQLYVTAQAFDQFENFCKQVRKVPERAEACNRDHLERAQQAHQPGAAWCRTCHAGVVNFRVAAQNKGVQVTLLGGEYQVTDDSALQAESQQNFGNFLKRFQVLPEEQTTLERLRDQIQKIEYEQLGASLPQMGSILEAYLAVVKELEDLSDILTRQQRKVAHEFGTLVDPIQRDVDYLYGLLGDGKLPARRQRQALHATLERLSDNAEFLFDSVATNLPEYFDLKFNPQPERIDHLIRTTANIFRTKAEWRNIEIRVEFEDAGSRREVELSRPHFASALRNLVDNAVKYTFHGTPDKKRYILIQGDPLPPHYEISVQNYGTGIDPDELAHVFEVGFQGRRKQKEHVTGAGLGLATTRRFIEMHGGKIRATSNCVGDPKDAGGSLPFVTRFVVEMPYLLPQHLKPVRERG